MLLSPQLRRAARSPMWQQHPATFLRVGRSEGGGGTGQQRRRHVRSPRPALRTTRCPGRARRDAAGSPCRHVQRSGPPAREAGRLPGHGGGGARRMWVTPDGLTSGCREDHSEPSAGRHCPVNIADIFADFGTFCHVFPQLHVLVVRRFTFEPRKRIYLNSFCAKSGVSPSGVPFPSAWCRHQRRQCNGSLCQPSGSGNTSGPSHWADRRSVSCPTLQRMQIGRCFRRAGSFSSPLPSAGRGCRCGWLRSGFVFRRGAVGCR